MAHRAVLTERQRANLFALPTDEASLLRHYILDDDDITHIRSRRRPENQIGFALQLCGLRFPGRLLRPGEIIPEEISRFLAAQLGLQPDDLLRYATREKTRREHLASLRKIYGYVMFTGKRAKQMRAWLEREAEVFAANFRRYSRHVRQCDRLVIGYIRGHEWWSGAVLGKGRRCNCQRAEE